MKFDLSKIKIMGQDAKSVALSNTLSSKVVENVTRNEPMSKMEQFNDIVYNVKERAKKKSELVRDVLDFIDQHYANVNEPEF